MTSVSNGHTQTPENMSECDMDFIGFGSDIEEPSPPSSSSAQESQDYWIGKKLFGYLIAKSLLSDVRRRDTMEHLDVSPPCLVDEYIFVTSIDGAGLARRVLADVPVNPLLSYHHSKRHEPKTCDA